MRPKGALILVFYAGVEKTPYWESNANDLGVLGVNYSYLHRPKSTSQSKPDQALGSDPGHLRKEEYLMIGVLCWDIGGTICLGTRNIYYCL